MFSLKSKALSFVVVDVLTKRIFFKKPKKIIPTYLLTKLTRKNLTSLTQHTYNFQFHHKM